MKSLRARVLALVIGFGLGSAVLLAIIMYGAVRSYYVDMAYEKSSQFAERIIEMHPDLWDVYAQNPPHFSAQLREYILYSPRTGLYLLDDQGRVLASAGEHRKFWDDYRVDLEPVRRSLDTDPMMPIVAEDPEREGKTCIVAARPIKDGGVTRGWLYVVVRSADLPAYAPDMLKSYAIRTSVAVSLTTLALGVIMTVAMIALLTKPLVHLTEVVERVKRGGFAEDLSDCSDDLQCGRHDEIGRLSLTFREMFERLKLEMQRVKQVDSRRREMVASVSHDLRTPLTALIGQLETVRMKADSLTAAEQQQYLSRALQNAQHLRRLTDALAELAKLDNPDFRTQCEPIAIGELADDVVQRHVTRAHDAGIELEVDYPDGLPLTSVDAALIERALANLIDNAIRVTPSGGKVQVRVANGGEGLRLEVIDTGPGVALEDQPRVFERFFQTSLHRESRGSSGLGLAIVKRVAELHGGRAGLSSQPGRGATFFIELPLPA